jgi:oligopeptide transport system ATP-binding protein
MKKELLAVRDLKKHFPVKKEAFLEKRRFVKAVDGISFSIYEGETLGLVGESGCGKSTTGKMIVRLIEPTEGTITYDGEDILRMPKSRSRELRRKIQMIFQDPYSSLDPRQTAGRIIEEPLIVNRQREGSRERVARLMADVGLSAEYAGRFPHEFSGGQRQRIGVARALALNPSLVVCDEPVSALDVSIQAQIVNLMQDLQEEYRLTYLFISHDLRIVKHISDRIAVMYLGRIVEIADRTALFGNPLHPYTRALLEAVPISDPTVKNVHVPLTGDVPSPIDPPRGCRFHTRCPRRMEVCESKEPLMRELEGAHFVECHLYGEGKRGEA